jgi:hypothetical protein
MIRQNVESRGVSENVIAKFKEENPDKVVLFQYFFMPSKGTKLQICSYL